MNVDLYKESLGKDKEGKPVFLKDIWPTNKEIEELILTSINADMFVKRYSNISEGPKEWSAIKTNDSNIYNWDDTSTYVKKPPFFENKSDLVYPIVKIPLHLFPALLGCPYKCCS